MNILTNLNGSWQKNFKKFLEMGRRMFHANGKKDGQMWHRSSFAKAPKEVVNYTGWPRIGFLGDTLPHEFLWEWCLRIRTKDGRFDLLRHLKFSGNAPLHEVLLRTTEAHLSVKKGETQVIRNGLNYPRRIICYWNWPYTL